MDNYTGGINLTRIPGAKKCSMNDQPGIFIPIDTPIIWAGEKSVILNIDIKESTNSMYGDSHFITTHVDNKAKRDELGDKVRDYEPIVGNIRPWGTRKKASAPTQETTTTEDNDSGLPF